ncbi:S16 family serine protease [Paraferrimonas haliotis]|uniref:endopeptidase La n=1 Tax=Paraferrimonas haliotis TaxID=2013866 RepID=A0AA37WZ86_9GAMM|nr:S16 family serine protease [Paraferrimonas haliotis]GLS84605.1 ATP-dependent protease [Paraferrimonas haliotis]
MTESSTRLSAKQLVPHFEQLALSDSNQTISKALLGQQRATETISLALSQAVKRQHVCLSHFGDMHLELLTQAISSQIEGDVAVVDKAISRQALVGNAQSPGLLTENTCLFIRAEVLLHQKQLCKSLLTELQHQTAALVVVLGHAHEVQSLQTIHSQFSLQFGLMAELNHEFEITEQGSLAYVEYLQAIADFNQLQLSESALLPLFTFSSWLTEHQNRLSLCSKSISQLMQQAAMFAKSSLISADHIQQARAHKAYRHDIQQQLSQQAFLDKFVLLQTEGNLVGQINALTVIDTPESSYGEPARVTATVHYGDGEVADIERKSDLGGNIHAKGMMILSACLYRIFGKDAPLHLNANIVFEQSYQEIDGDSASLAEYLALISAISDLPIRQELSVTGAIDQFGNVQAIGGLNEKIEGFYRLCQQRGLTGQQGVVIPAANAIQLNLPEEIVGSVKEQQFHIYQVDHIDEAIQLLLQHKAGSVNDDGLFPKESVYGRVQSRLDELAGDIEPETTWFGRLLRRLVN